MHPHCTPPPTAPLSLPRPQAKGGPPLAAPCLLPHPLPLLRQAARRQQQEQQGLTHPRPTCWQRVRLPALQAQQRRQEAMQLAQHRRQLPLGQGPSRALWLGSWMWAVWRRMSLST